MVVSLEDIRALDAYFSDVILGEVLHVGYISQLDHITIERDTNIARARITDCLTAGDAAAFGLTVAFDDECAADTFQKLENGRRERRCSTDQQLHAATQPLLDAFENNSIPNLVTVHTVPFHIFTFRRHSSVK